MNIKTILAIGVGLALLNASGQVSAGANGKGNGTAGIGTPAFGARGAVTPRTGKPGRGGRSNLQIPTLVQGPDNNSVRNPFVQPQDPALSGGGRDQSLQFADVLFGTNGDNVINGSRGPDVIAGGRRDDVLLGGQEHFTPDNRDRAFGGPGDDIFIWKPGDGSDFFDGGPGQDVLVMGVTGELVGDAAAFQVLNDGQAGVLFIDPDTGLPKVDVSNMPGFCEIVDDGSSADAANQLDALSLDHLVRFSLRGVRDSFEAGEQSDDNGLRITMHLADVEVLVCTSREGGRIQFFDLTHAPAREIDPRRLNRRLRERLDDIVF